MTSGLSVQFTPDGSTTLRHEELDETYHSRHGALTESVHVYIENGLAYRHREDGSPRPLRIFEMGFGTGLNALLTWDYADREKVPVEYASVEKHPLEETIWQQLRFPGVSQESVRIAHEASWEERVILSPFFSLTKRNVDLRDAGIARSAFDVVYYDAFAPSRQPDLWDAQTIGKTAAALAPQGVWVTYCAQGQLKRNLRAAGLLVESLPGPPGKREMVRARCVN